MSTVDYSQLNKLLENVRALVVADPSTLATMNERVAQLRGVVANAESQMASMSWRGSADPKRSYPEQLAALSADRRSHLDRFVGKDSAAAQIASARALGWL